MFVQFAGVAFASFVYIAAKAFQQLNVVHGYKRLVPMFTFVMATCEVAVVGNIALEVTGGGLVGLALTVAAMTTGGASGAIASMYFHERMRGRRKGEDEGHQS